jgi:hypothetical protein
LELFRQEALLAPPTVPAKPARKSRKSKTANKP